MSKTFCDVFQLNTFLNLIGSTYIPPSEMMWPGNETSFNQNSHLLSLAYSLIFSKLLQYHTKMFIMIFFIFGEYQNAIDEYYHELVQILHEDFVHQVHEVGRCIG
jgi:hypothetical protein